MKKIMTNIKTLAALLMVGVAFAACSSSDDSIIEQPVNPTEPKTYTMTIPASKGDGNAATRGLYIDEGQSEKTLKVNWNGTEKVRVVQNGNVIGTLTATASSSANTTLSGTVTGVDMSKDIKFILLADENGKMDYTGQVGALLTENGTGNIEENYDFASYELSGPECQQAFTTDGSNLVAKDGTIIAFESQQAIVKFKLQKPTGTGTEWGDLFATKLIVSDKNTGKLVQSYDALTGAKTYGDITLTATGVGTSSVFNVALNLDGTSDIMLQAFDSNGNLYTYEKSDVTFTKGSYYIVNVKMTVLTEAVDLGLSVKWATMNIGATSVTDPGKYFAWGATKPGTTFTWSNTPYYTGDGTTHSWSKYTTNESTLDATDDAAVQNWGGNWRMPTYTEWTELLKDNCTCTWVANYNESGISGALITSKKSGYTDKSIFLPASGYYDVTTGALTNSDKAYCWIPLLYGGENGSNALYVDFASGSYGVQNKERADGMPIRPVMPQ